jgi:hypothetical protein
MRWEGHVVRIRGEDAHVEIPYCERLLGLDGRVALNVSEKIQWENLD